MPEFIIDIEYHPKKGNEAVVGWGEVLIASQEVILARDLCLKTIKNLVAIPTTGKYTTDPHSGVKDTIPWVTKYIYNKGEPDNWATIHLWDDTTSEHTGSVWLNITYLGE